MTISATLEFVLSSRDIIKRLMCRKISEITRSSIRKNYNVNFNNIEYFFENV